MKDYTLLYEIDGSNIRPCYGGEVKISPGIMLLVSEPSTSADHSQQISTKIMDIGTGQVQYPLSGSHTLKVVYSR